MTPEKFFNKPLLMEPTRAQILVDNILNEDVAHFGEFQTNSFSPTLIEGIAVIPIMGTLLNRRNPFTISHQDIAATLLEAVADDSVSAILLDIDSGGGEANGVFDLSETIRELDAQKPIFAIANDAAFSGAFAIASAARKIFVTRTGGVGSIGVIAHHMDISEFHKDMGIKITAIFAGEHKGELSPFQPLSDGAKARVQQEVDKTFEMFVNLIAEHRDLSTEKIISTQAGLFFGQDAVNLGLADHVTTFDGAMEMILNTETHMQLFSKVNKEASESDNLETDAELSSTTEDGPEKNTENTDRSILKCGEGLANFLNDRIDQMADDDEDERQAIIERMASEANISVSTVRQILAGQINCPPLNRLEGFARALEISVESMISVAETRDGCDYSQSDNDTSEDVHATSVEISQMALKAGCASMIPSLLAEPLTVEQVEEKLQVSEKIISLCAKAGCPKKADKYIEDKVSVVDVQDELINFMARASAKHDVNSKVDAEGIDNEVIKGYASNNEGTNPLVADAEKRHADFQTHYKGAE